MWPCAGLQMPGTWPAMRASGSRVCDLDQSAGVLIDAYMDGSTCSLAGERSGGRACARPTAPTIAVLLVFEERVDMTHTALHAPSAMLIDGWADDVLITIDALTE